MNPPPSESPRASAISSLIGRCPKTVLFGGIGALGCLLGALLGELLLSATRTPAPPPTTSTPGEVCLLIDCSSSMAGNPIEEVKRAASDFVGRQNLEQGRLAVVRFSSDAVVVAPLGSNANELKRAIDGFRANGGTEMHLGLSTSIQHISTSNQNLKSTPGGDKLRAILLFTDGQPGNPKATLQAAAAARQEGIKVVCVGTGGANMDYLGQLAGNQAQVFAAGDGRFADAFQRAEKIIYEGNLIERTQGTRGSAPGFAVARIAGWTALLSLGVGLALILGQNAYLRRQLFQPKEGALGVLGSVVAGLVAGALGQALFAMATQFPAIETAGRVLAWAILGGLIGLGMTFFVPNLKPLRAILGGAVGGAVGCTGFFLFGAALGDVAGRLTGAALLGFFIGLMIVLVEQLAREACLLVHWGPGEVTTVSLGAKPVVLGSSREAHIYLPREKGFPSVTALCRFTGGKVEFENKITGKKDALQNGSKIQLGTLMIEVRTAK